MTVAENIRRLRKEKGLTQKQLGKLCSPPIAESAIRQYELGLRNPKLENLRRISEALETPIYNLTDEFETNPYPNEEKHFSVNSVLLLLEKAGYRIIQVPCLYNHNDWKVRTVTQENGNKITVAMNEKLSILTKGCTSYKREKMYCDNCKNIHFDKYIIQKEGKRIILTIDEMQKKVDEIIKYIDFIFHQQEKT